MSKKLFVFSTLTSAVNYNVYAKNAPDMPRIERTITIEGGANLTNKNLMTPRGVATSIDAEDLAALEENTIFQMHRKNGFITISESEGNADSVAADMTDRDASAPLVDGDFVAAGEDTPTTSAKPASRKRN